ncbi:DUF1934 domain-containing protein [Streptococcus ictaluri]|uniref:DUF1934 domain-containing protein n=1 Tax=Streptococcus ictaluri 707-05 TaxID=764299 RepID=G5K090_9STRE|nr:DUF1934 domain-containing protein [Streptococcus ictaluri]EHI70656.1 hypothetical protein STRIC_0009 [Streptococcus ictaluri 707-05]
MKLEITNRITLDQDTELIEEVHVVDVKEKANATYLIYENDDKEKVVIKLKEEELTMSRFSKPQSLMIFKNQQQVLIALPTPAGIQQFVTDTKTYHLDLKKQEVVLAYALLQANSELAFANYDLKLKWYND